MPQYLEGTPQAVATFKELLNDLHGRGYLVWGSVGRAAIGASLGWPRTKPLQLEYEPPYSMAKGQWKDVDVMDLRDQAGRSYRHTTRTPDFPVGFNINDIFDPGFIAVRRQGRQKHRISVLPLLQKTVTRRLDGAKVRTIPLASFMLVERLTDSPDHLVRADLLAMTKWAKGRHPGEFLPPTVYEPFLDFAQTARYPAMAEVRKLLVG